MNFEPFENSIQSQQIDNLTIENQGERISIYGSVQIQCDQRSLENLKTLQQIIEKSIAYLQQQENLPEHVTPMQDDVEEVPNPFL